MHEAADALDARGSAGCRQAGGLRFDKEARSSELRSASCADGHPCQATMPRARAAAGAATVAPRRRQRRRRTGGRTWLRRRGFLGPAGPGATAAMVWAQAAIECGAPDLGRGKRWYGPARPPGPHARMDRGDKTRCCLSLSLSVFWGVGGRERSVRGDRSPPALTQRWAGGNPQPERVRNLWPSLS